VLRVEIVAIKSVSFGLRIGARAANRESCGWQHTWRRTHKTSKNNSSAPRAWSLARRPLMGPLRGARARHPSTRMLAGCIFCWRCCSGDCAIECCVCVFAARQMRTRRPQRFMGPD
jgi:hypothetical protein